MKFLSPDVGLYLYKSAVCSRMEYCCHIWAGSPRYYLELLVKLQKRICSTVGPSFSAALEPFAHHKNVARLNLFCSGVTLLFEHFPSRVSEIENFEIFSRPQEISLPHNFL